MSLQLYMTSAFVVITGQAEALGIVKCEPDSNLVLVVGRSCGRGVALTIPEMPFGIDGAETEGVSEDVVGSVRAYDLEMLRLA